MFYVKTTNFDKKRNAKSLDFTRLFCVILFVVVKKYKWGEKLKRKALSRNTCKKEGMISFIKQLFC